MHLPKQNDSLRSNIQKTMLHRGILIVAIAAVLLATARAECAIGSGQTEGSACEPCTIGETYSDVDTTDVACAPCTECGADEALTTECTTSADAVCTPCGAGHTVDESSDPEVCVACPTGEVAAAAAETCTTCGEGLVPNNDQSLCVPPPGECAANEYEITASDESTDTVCGTCLAGQIPALTECQNCLAGTFSAAASETCTACAAGSVSSDGEGECVSCDPGVSYSNIDQSECIDVTLCESDEYASAIATASTNAVCVTATTCYTATHFMSAESTPDTDTICTPNTDCSAGSYIRPVAGSSTLSECGNCAVGKYSDAAGVTACVDCMAGTSNNAVGSPTCDACEFGNWSVAGQATCTNRTSCDGSLINERYALRQGANVCSDKSQVEAGAYWFDTNGGRGKERCPSGTYQDETGQGKCKTCSSTETPAPDMYKSYQEIHDEAASITEFLKRRRRRRDVAVLPAEPTIPTSTTCTPCAAGKFNGELYIDIPTQRDACVVCPIGTYQDDAGSDECKACASGMYNPTAGLATACSLIKALCDQGGWNEFYDDATVEGNCVAACPVGKTLYTPDTGVGGCIVCSPGSYKAVEGNGPCLPCPKEGNATEWGYSFQSASAATCWTCRPGEFWDATGRECADCPAGTYKSGKGPDTCKAHTTCTGTPVKEAGTATTDTECVSCPAGQYYATSAPDSASLAVLMALESDAPGCRPCEGNSIVPVPSQETKCAACAEGRQANAEKTRCTATNNGGSSTSSATAVSVSLTAMIVVGMARL